MILENVSRLPELYKLELLRGERVQAELAILQQTRLKEASDLLETRHVEGLGQKVLSIHPNLAARLRLKFGMSCLHEPHFRRRLLERNPFLRVRSIPQKTTLRVDGFRIQGSGVRAESQTSGNGQREGSAGRYGAQGEPATPFRRGGVRHLNQEISGHETIPGVSLARPQTPALDPDPNLDLDPRRSKGLWQDQEQDQDHEQEVPCAR